MQPAALLLLAGAGAPAAAWAPVTGLLGGRVRAQPFEREPGAGFAAEAARVAALALARGGMAGVLGHSGGAVVALEAALLTGAVGRLVLYEPPLLAGHEPYRQEALAELMRRAIAAGDPDQAVAAFMRRAAGTSEARLQTLRGSSRWRALTADAGSLLRALAASHAYRFRPGRFRRLAAPALLLVGSESVGLHRASVEALARALPAAEVVELPGQAHSALAEAPELVATAIARFLVSPDRSRR